MNSAIFWKGEFVLVCPSFHEFGETVSISIFFRQHGKTVTSCLELTSISSTVHCTAKTFSSSEHKFSPLASYIHPYIHHL